MYLSTACLMLVVPYTHRGKLGVLLEIVDREGVRCRLFRFIGDCWDCKGRCTCEVYFRLDSSNAKI